MLMVRSGMAGLSGLNDTPKEGSLTTTNWWGNVVSTLGQGASSLFELEQLKRQTQKLGAEAKIAEEARMLETEKTGYQTTAIIVTGGVLALVAYFYFSRKRNKN